MKTRLRNWLINLLRDDIELIVNVELVNSSPVYLDGEEITRVVHREIARNNEALTDSMSRQRSD